MGSFGSTFRPPFGIPQPTSIPPDNGFSTLKCDKPIEEQLPHELYPWTFPPDTFQTFRPIGFIDLPAVGVTSVMLTLTAKVGWDGVVLKVGHGYIGAGFTECDLSLEWGIFINGNQPVPNMGIFYNQMGDIKSLEDISPGFIVKSGQSVQYKCKNVSLVAGGAKVWGAFQGYWWRNQQGKAGTT